MGPGACNALDFDAIAADDDGVSDAAHWFLHSFLGAVLFRSVNGVSPISADLPSSGNKPLCAGDGEAKGWSTAGFWAIMLIHIQHCERLSLTLDEALLSVVTVGLVLASEGNRLLISVQPGSGGNDLGHDKVDCPKRFESTTGVDGFIHYWIAMGFTHFVMVHSLTKNGHYLSFDQ